MKSGIDVLGPFTALFLAISVGFSAAYVMRSSSHWMFWFSCIAAYVLAMASIFSVLRRRYHRVCESRDQTRIRQFNRQVRAFSLASAVCGIGNAALVLMKSR